MTKIKNVHRDNIAEYLKSHEVNIQVQIVKSANT